MTFVALLKIDDLGGIVAYLVPCRGQLVIEAVRFLSASIEAVQNQFGSRNRVLFSKFAHLVFRVFDSFDAHYYVGLERRRDQRL